MSDCEIMKFIYIKLYISTSDSTIVISALFYLHIRFALYTSGNSMMFSFFSPFMNNSSDNISTQEYYVCERHVRYFWDMWDASVAEVMHAKNSS